MCMSFAAAELISGYSSFQTFGHCMNLFMRFLQCQKVKNLDITIAITSRSVSLAWGHIWPSEIEWKLLLNVIWTFESPVFNRTKMHYNDPKRCHQSGEELSFSTNAKEIDADFRPSVPRRWPRFMLHLSGLPQSGWSDLVAHFPSVHIHTCNPRLLAAPSAFHWYHRYWCRVPTQCHSWHHAKKHWTGATCSYIGSICTTCDLQLHLQLLVVLHSTLWRLSARHHKKSVSTTRCCCWLALPSSMRWGLSMYCTCPARIAGGCQHIIAFGCSPWRSANSQIPPQVFLHQNHVHLS